MRPVAKITAIESQKRNKNRCSVFLDDEFAFGVDAAILVQAGLKCGDGVSPRQIERLKELENRKRIKEKAYRLLAQRAHSEKELREKLQRKGFEFIMIDDVIDELKRLSFIDDVNFAQMYARSRVITRPMGQKLLRLELHSKGIAESGIQIAIKEAYAQKSELELAVDLVRRRIDRYKGKARWEVKKKLGDFLLRRGFDWEIAEQAIESVLQTLGM